MSELFAGLLSRSSAWGVALTIAAFGVGALFQRRTGKAWCSPLLIGALLVMAALAVTGTPYPEFKASAGPVSYLLLPATVSLAIPLYEKWDLLKKNATAILTGISAGVAVSLGSIVLLARVMGLDRAQAVTLLPKSVTTAIGMDVAEALGGMPSLAGAVIVLTGIGGSLMAQWVCDVMHIRDPIARGIGIGTASHAIGTAKALEMGEVEGAMSGLAIAVAGILTAVLAPVFANLLG